MLKPLPKVTALLDKGTVIEVPTRWCPRVVLCATQTTNSSALILPSGVTDSKSGTDYYAVKYRRCNQSTAASISEVVCYGILALMGIHTLEPSLALVSTNFTNSYLGKVEYSIRPGLHFCTLLRKDFFPSGTDPKPEFLVDDLENPKHLISLWVADCWYMNIDRCVYGNIMLGPGKSKLRLIASDQSDCFHGSLALSDGSYVQHAKQDTGSASLPYLETLIFDDPNYLGKVTETLQSVAKNLGSVFSLVPTEWWAEADVSPQDLQNVLVERAKRIRKIIKLDHWIAAQVAAQGGHLLVV